MQLFIVPDTQPPDTHASPIVHALPSSQVLLQPPQCGSADRSPSQPLALLPSQSSQPASQPVITHWPDWHAVVACGSVQLHPHWFSTPAEPHSSPLGQEPQSISKPQPLCALPQLAPICEQLLAMHPHWLSLPSPPQVSGSLHLPQSSASEQPSETSPQLAPSWAQDFGEQLLVPHMFGPPPPHVCPAGHVPQSRIPLQPLGIVPQVAKSWAQVLGAHPHWPGLPPPPQVCGTAQAPQSMASEHMSEA